VSSSTATCHRRGAPRYALADQNNTSFGRGSFPNDYNDDGLDDYLSHRLVIIEIKINYYIFFEYSIDLTQHEYAHYIIIINKVKLKTTEVR